LPVTHTSGDAVFSGSVVKQGEIDALVYGTGRNTHLRGGGEYGNDWWLRGFR